MTIEQLLDLPAEGLAAISDEELVKMLSPYFPVTRPQRILTPAVTPTAKAKAVTKTILDRILSDPTITPDKVRAMSALLK